jgi:hypothetical protein
VGDVWKFAQITVTPLIRAFINLIDPIVRDAVHVPVNVMGSLLNASVVNELPVPPWTKF